MKRVEEIKEKRQSQYIFDRQKKAKQIEKEKDIKEVKRDLALIRSPAAGLKRTAKQMEMDEDEIEEMQASTSTMNDDTTLNLKSLTKSKKKSKRAKVVQEVESDHEMLAAEENWNWFFILHNFPAKPYWRLFSVKNKPSLAKKERAFVFVLSVTEINKVRIPNRMTVKRGPRIKWTIANKDTGITHKHSKLTASLTHLIIGTLNK